MRNITFATPFEGAVDYPNSIAFMYSRQPVIVRGTADMAAQVRVTVTCETNGGKSHTETRAMYQGRAEFDISRIMQLLAPDVDTLLQRIDYDRGASLSEIFSLTVTIQDAEGYDHQLLSLPSGIVARYGTLDQGEIFGEHTQRRLWINLPQTFSLWKDAHDETAFVLDWAYIYPDIVEGAPDCECDLVGTLHQLEDTELLATLMPGHPLHDVGLTWKTRIERGAEIPEEFRTVTLVPDASRLCEGTYLRWLNRRGEVSYWLFKTSQIRVTSTQHDSFVRYYQGDPAENFTNPQKADYREARELVLGAVGLSRDEYDDLCDLAVSPVVERLVPPVSEEDTEVDVVLDGGRSVVRSRVVVDGTEVSDTTVEAGDASVGARVLPPYTWQRVNVAAGTFARNIRRNTPSRQDLEFVIELPERNTIKL